MLSYLPCCLLPGIALALVTRTQDEEIHGLVNGAGRAEADQDTDRETARLSAVAAATKLHPAYTSVNTAINTATRDDGGLQSCDPLGNIFVLNVPGPVGAARRVSAEAELAKADIHQYTFQAAVVPSEVSYPQVLDAGEFIRLKDGHYKISAGEAALSLSHGKIYQKMVDEGISCALVFEDDFHLVDPATFKYRLSRTPLPVEYDWVKLDQCGHKGELNASIPSTPPKVMPGCGPCTSGYLVSNAGARLLLQANTPLWMNADGNMDPYHIKFTAAAARLPVKSFHFDPQLSWQTDLSNQGGIFQLINTTEKSTAKAA